MLQLFRLKIKKLFRYHSLHPNCQLNKMPFDHPIEASWSLLLPSYTSETRKCGRCNMIVPRMYSKRMNSVITHRDIYRAVGLCEPCNIENDFEMAYVRFRVISKRWRNIVKRGMGADGCGFSMEDPGAGLVHAIIECLVGSNSEKELTNRTKALCLHALCCLPGNTRILTWTWDRKDPELKHCPELVYLRRDLMQRVITFLYPRAYNRYGDEENQYSQAMFAYMWHLNMPQLTFTEFEWERLMQTPEDLHQIREERRKGMMKSQRWKS